MRYGSVCSGIEAATMAWHALGWEPAFFSEIEAFPRAVLEHHYPAVPLHGDFTTIEENQYGKIDLLVGGTPCQSFSVAGLRGGLDDERGNLALEFCRLAQRERPRWIVWENVPGVLSSNGGRDFGSILGALAELGYGLAYRVLDAQYFGVAQRRRRVFVVGYLGDWRRAAAVLFERHSLSGHPAPRREARKDAASGSASGADSGGGSGRERLAVEWPAAVANTLDTDYATKWGQNNQHVNAGYPLFVPDNIGTFNDDGTARTLTARYDGSPCVDRGPDVVGTLRTRRPGEGGVQGAFEHIVPAVSPALNTQSGSHHAPDTKAYVAIAIQERAICENPNAGPDGVGVRTDDAAYTLEARTVPQAVAFQQNTRDEVRYIGGDGQIVGALAAQSGMKQTNYVAYDLRGRDGGSQLEGPHDTANIRAASGGSSRSYVAFTDLYNGAISGNVAPTMGTSGSRVNASGPTLMLNSAVRRLTPRECERLQGFPDDYTLVQHRNKPAADGPRYKALGNSMAVPVMRWIGERIQMIEDLTDVL